jgi:hypothetical protein
MSTKSLNKLQMYCLQNRADDFIREFENVSLQTAKSASEIGSYDLFAYAANALLNTDGWSGNYDAILKTIHSQNVQKWLYLHDEGKVQDDYNALKVTDVLRSARAENLRIWQYLLDNKQIPTDYHNELIRYGKQWAWADNNSSYEDIFDATQEELVEWGARKIDCRLQMAVMQLNFEKVESLLQRGANPQAKIHVEEPELDDTAEYVSPLDHAKQIWLAAYDAFGNLYEAWEYGYNKIDAEIPAAAFIQLITSSSNKFMYDLLLRYC